MPSASRIATFSCKGNIKKRDERTKDEILFFYDSSELLHMQIFRQENSNCCTCKIFLQEKKVENSHHAIIFSQNTCIYRGFRYDGYRHKPSSSHHFFLKTLHSRKLNRWKHLCISAVPLVQQPRELRVSPGGTDSFLGGNCEFPPRKLARTAA